MTPDHTSAAVSGGGVETAMSQLMSPMAFSVQPPPAARRDLSNLISNQSSGGSSNIPVAINPPQHVNIPGIVGWLVYYNL